jgi:hypothetical protein
MLPVVAAACGFTRYRDNYGRLSHGPIDVLPPS